MGPISFMLCRVSLWSVDSVICQGSLHLIYTLLVSIVSHVIGKEVCEILDSFCLLK